MKKYYMLIILSLFIVVCMVPVKAVAEDLNVGVKVDGALIIDVTTTINADIVVDVNNKLTKPPRSFVHIVNNGNYPIDAKITNIESTSSDSPTTFVPINQTQPADGKEWETLNEADTKKYISFGISDGNQSPQSILPDTTIDLGNINYYDSAWGSSSDSNNNEEVGSRSYVLSAKTGYVWGSVTSFTYKITTLFQLSSNYTPPLTPKHDGINSIGLTGYMNSSSLKLNANINAASSYTLPSKELIYFGGTIVSPSGVISNIDSPTSGNDITINTDTADSNNLYDISYTINKTFSESGTYYVIANFGFKTSDGKGGYIFNQTDNYSKVISFTFSS